MLTTVTPGIFPIEAVKEFPLNYAYSVERSGNGVLRLPQHVQKGSSYLYDLRYSVGETHGHDAKDLRGIDNVVSVLINRDSFHGGLPSHGLDMDQPRSRELYEAKYKLWVAATALEKLKSPYADPVFELEEVIANEIAEKNLAAAHKKALDVGKFIADVGKDGRNLWLIVTPPKTDNRVNLLDEYKEDDEIKVAMLRGLVVFEEDNKVYANPVVEGKRRRIGQIVTSNYNSRHGYLFA